MVPVATTHPSSSTDPGHAAARSAAISWVFPAPLAMPIAGGQVVGRDADCDTVLAGTEISRRHAEFRVDGPVVTVRDRESRNGVFVNGRRVTDAPLAAGDVVRCGEWLGVVVMQAATGGPPSFGEITPEWFGGAALRAAIEPAKLMAADLAIVVQGETGTGKEGAARAIHDWSGRPGPLVAVNCATLPAELAEAELFGYRKGAFTGADAKNDGLFRAADGGTLFLDEILDLPLVLQAKLLRVLEDRKVRAIGETRAVPIDVRVVAATQEPLAAAVAARRFRPDLQARLEGLTVALPPLRSRREDIAPLFLTFLDRHGHGRAPPVETKLLEALCLYDWPLNVRELLLLARRMLALHGHEPALRKAHLPASLLDPKATDPDEAPAAQVPPLRRAWRKTDDRDEFDALVKALRDHGGSVARAAATLGMNRSRAYRLLEAHPAFSLEDVRS
jgi:transcriptional regulator with AAA-type ATPase domain